MCKAENRALVELRAVCVRRPSDDSLVVRVQVRGRNDEWLTAQQWLCDSGRPTPSQLADISCCLDDEIQRTIVGTIGVQGVL